MHFQSWKCQRCGAPIGWLGRFVRGLLGRRLYARLIGCDVTLCGVSQR